MRYQEENKIETETEAKEITNQKEPKKSNKLVRFILILIIIFVILFLYARYISTSGLIIKEYKVASANLPESFHGIKIVHFSDLHYGTTINESELANIVDKINELKPDIVIFTGDLVDEDHHPNDEQVATLKKYLTQINATFSKYAVSGNHDYTIEDISSLYEGTGFKYLENEREDIYYEGETPISIYAFPSAISGTPDYTILNNQDNNYKIIILHEPDSIDDLITYKPDLVLAGHSHGGQVRLPFIGAIYTPIGSKKYFEEFYQLDNTQLYISSGLGTSGLKVRYFNRPSINLYRLASISNEEQ